MGMCGLIFLYHDFLFVFYIFFIKKTTFFNCKSLLLDNFLLLYCACFFLPISFLNRMYFFRLPFLMVGDPDMIKEILIKEFPKFHDRRVI